MPIQSYLMMYFAGSGWQYGKRKISAMSNEEFNKLDMKTLLEQHTMELKSIQPTLEGALRDINPLIKILIEQYGEFIRIAIDTIPQVAKELVKPTLSQAEIGFEKLGHRLEEAILAGAEYLPHVHETDASHGEEYISESKKLAEFEDTHEKRVALQKIEDARIKRLKELLFAQVGAAERKELRDAIGALPPQLSLGEKANISLGLSAGIDRRKAAGQSQKLYKIEITKVIKTRTHDLKLLKISLKDRMTPNNIAIINGKQKVLTADIQSLSNLLARYRFD